MKRIIEEEFVFQTGGVPVFERAIEYHDLLGQELPQLLINENAIIYLQDGLRLKNLTKETIATAAQVEIYLQSAKIRQYGEEFHTFASKRVRASLMECLDLTYDNFIEPGVVEPDQFFALYLAMLQDMVDVKNLAINHLTAINQASKAEEYGEVKLLTIGYSLSQNPALPLSHILETAGVANLCWALYWFEQTLFKEGKYDTPQDVTRGYFYMLSSCQALLAEAWECFHRATIMGTRFELSKQVQSKLQTNHTLASYRINNNKRREEEAAREWRPVLDAVKTKMDQNDKLSAKRAYEIVSGQMGWKKSLTSFQKHWKRFTSK